MYWLPLGFAFVAIVSRLIVSRWPKPKTLGVVNNRLATCPDKPNCVSSSDTNEELGPIPTESDGQAEFARIKDVLEQLPRTEIVVSSDDYLHAIQRSLLMAYPDDIEFHLDRDAKVIHWRSASRIGYSDLGVNRNRVVSILKKVKPNGE